MASKRGAWVKAELQEGASLSTNGPVSVKTQMTQNYAAEDGFVATLRLNPYAQLVHWRDDSVSMLFEGRQFGREEQLPLLSHSTRMGPDARYSAESFVAKCVISEFGTDSRKWPDIACRFLFATVVPERNLSTLARALRSARARRRKSSRVLLKDIA